MPQQSTQQLEDMVALTIPAWLPPTGPELLVEPQVVTAYGWTVTWCQGRGGLVRVVRTGEGLVLTVGDEPHTADRRTRVVLHRDGALTVRAAATPPGLLVSPASARTIPAVPGIPERAALSPEHRLLVLSADALDAMPQSLAAVLQELPAQVMGAAPADLLSRLFADLPGGSGAVVTRD